MRSSSATQSKRNFEDSFIEPDNLSVARNEPLTGTSSDFAVNFGTQGFDRSTYAASSRRAGRINAANVSDDEVKSLLRERRELLEKKFLGTMSLKESHRLALIRWNLDRIEDAKHGQHLEMLESAIARYENFQTEINRLMSDIASVKANRSR